jgi:hypothetical protein
MSNVILEQLGGNKFRVMTGAKNFVADGDAMLLFTIGGGAKSKINRVRVRIMPNDLYQMEFFAGRMLDLRKVATVADVYADRLAAVFTEHTGFDTSL